MRFARLLPLLWAAALSLRAADPAASDPASELATFQVADGFDVNLFASEKDGLIKPIQIRFDARGRLWVIGSAVYPMLEPGQKPNDKVLIFEDTDHDGRVDSVKTFADGLMIPTGLELTKDGAYVGHGPELLLLRDTNGDDRADERTVVLRGFGTGDNHQNINSFTWGPRGELWMCQGLHIFSRVETPRGLVELNKAGIWRFWPNQLKLEGFYGSEFEPQNPWGHVFNEWNEHIVLAGNNSSPIFPDVGLVPNRRDDAPPLLWPNGNGRKVSGGDFVANPHFPDDWQGRLILGGYINNAVWSVNVVDDGAGFRFEDAPPLIRSTGREFRPVDVKFGPDGALYLCDWYNPIIGHYQASFRHPDRDKTHGRIWRVTAKNRPLAAATDLTNATPENLLTELASTNRWARQAAKRHIANSAPADQLALIKQISSSKNAIADQVKIDALNLFQPEQEPSLAIQLLRELSASKIPQIRASAASLFAIWAGRVDLPLDNLRALAADENPRVRLQAIIACAQLNTPEAIEIAAIAADQPFDRFLTYAFNQTVYSLKAQWLPRFQSGDLKFEGHPERLAAIVRADASPDTLGVLRELLKTPSAEFTQILAEVGTPDDLADVLKLGAARLDAKTLRIISQRTIRPSGDLVAALQPLFSSPLQAQALVLAGQWKLEPFLSKLRETARDASASADLRKAAMQGLGHAGDIAPLRELAATQPAAIAAWQALEPKPAAEAAAAFLTQNNSAHDAPDLINAFLQRPASAKALADALAGKTLPDAVSKAALAALAASGRRHDELAHALAPKPAAAAPTDWPAFVSEVRERGDANAGAAIYARAELGCVACHKVNGNGGTIGPNLSAVGSAQPIDFIARAILEPQKEIKEGFTSVSITTKSGDDFQGYLIRETRDEIVLRDPLPNTEVKIARAQIAQQRANGSLMPNGLADSLTADEFRDLVKYLSTLGKP